MAGSARWAVVGLACLLVLLDVEAILLEVDYPQTGNYNYVTLTCKSSVIDGLTQSQRPARFWRGELEITSPSDLVTVTASTDVSISFVFNQAQEGSYKCTTKHDEESNVEKLSASPPATYNTPMMPHYILFPSLESMRKVNLSCAIQPGALTENYQVSWRRVKPTPTSYSDDTFNITVTETTEMSSIPSEYRCIVSIDHSSMEDEDYETPIVVVHKRVLSTQSGEIGDVSVATGEPATFVCNAIKQDTSFSISWKVDGEMFTCGASSENIPCYMNNETSSVLQIENTTALGVRSHVVECILQNVVPEEFRGDCVLLPRGPCDVIKSATLEIRNGPTPTVTSIKTDCGDPPELVNGTIRSRNATLVIYHCDDQHYSPTGASDMSRTCLPNGNWSNEQFYCSLANNSSWMSSPKFHGGATYDVVIITTTVATVLASIIMVLIFGVYCWQRRKMKAKKHEPPMNAETLPADTSEHSFPGHHTSTTSGDTGSSQLQQQPYPLTLTEHLQQELSCKHMLFQKHHLELSKVVGQGESGLVYRGYINSSGGRELVAVKTGKALASPTDKEKLLKEVCVMLSFSHKNVMSLIGLCLDGEVPLLIMPFMINGTVLNYIKQNRENLYFGRSADKKQVESARIASLGVCHQIANGMSYLTKHKFVHRDLAARNCMIDENGVIKVADFGLTEDMYATNYYRRGGGEGGEGGTGGHEEKVPIRWMAPESIEADFYDEKTDVWSFGVTCWEVMTCGGVPYTGIHIMSLLRELNSGHRLDRPSNAVCSDEIWEMMTSCWSTSPGNRPTFTLLVKEFYQMLDNDTSYLKLNDSFKKSQLNTLV